LKFRVFAAPETAINDGLQMIGVRTPIRNAGALKFLEKPQPVDTSRSASRISSRIDPPGPHAAHAPSQWHQLALLNFVQRKLPATITPSVRHRTFERCSAAISLLVRRCATSDDRAVVTFAQRLAIDSMSNHAATAFVALRALCSLMP
jgi:hypothetical protein